MLFIGHSPFPEGGNDWEDQSEALIILWSPLEAIFVDVLLMFPQHFFVVHRKLYSTLKEPPKNTGTKSQI